MVIVLTFGPFRLQDSEPIESVIDEQLAHPIYPIARLADNVTGTWQWGVSDALRQADDMQRFMWYNDYHSGLFDNKTYAQASEFEKNAT